MSIVGALREMLHFPPKKEMDEKTTQPTVTDADVRWARAEQNELVRRAKKLGIEVDLESMER